MVAPEEWQISGGLEEQGIWFKLVFQETLEVLLEQITSRITNGEGDLEELGCTTAELSKQGTTIAEQETTKVELGE